MRQNALNRLVWERDSSLMRVTLRRATGADDAFIRKLAFDTIAIELCAAGWPEPMRTRLLDLQVMTRLPHASEGGERENLIIEADTASAGMVVLSSIPGELRLTEIMVRPEFRNRGIGSQAIRLILSVAKLPVRLLVTSANHDAIRLYERLGFRMVSRGEVQSLMEYC